MHIILNGRALPYNVTSPRLVLHNIIRMLATSGCLIKYLLHSLPCIFRVSYPIDRPPKYRRPKSIPIIRLKYVYNYNYLDGNSKLGENPLVDNTLFTPITKAHDLS